MIGRFSKPEAHAHCVVLFLAWLVCSTAVWADTRALVDQGQRAFEKGAFSDAASNWQEALDACRRQGDADGEVQAAVALASAYQALGQHLRAVELLTNTLEQASQKSGPRVTLVKSRLGAALAMTGQTDRAASLLSEALEAARGENNSQLTSAILNDQGNLLAAEQKYAEALAAFEQSVTLADQNSNVWLKAQVLCNAAATAARAGQFEKAAELNGQALGQIEPLESGHAKAFLLLRAGKTDGEIKPADSDSARRLL